ELAGLELPQAGLRAEGQRLEQLLVGRLVGALEDALGPQRLAERERGLGGPLRILADPGEPVDEDLEPRQRGRCRDPDPHLEDLAGPRHARFDRGLLVPRLAGLEGDPLAVIVTQKAILDRGELLGLSFLLGDLPTFVRHTPGIVPLSVTILKGTEL